MKYLILLLLSFNALAQQSVGASHAVFKQVLDFEKGYISFPQDAIELRYDYLTDYGLGARLAVSRSTETANSNYIENRFYTNKIMSAFHGSVFYRFKLNDKWSTDLSVGKASYNTKWTVNGKEPAWSKGSDTDYTKGILVNYKYHDNFYMYLGYYNLYEKLKEGYGKEKTQLYQFGFAYTF